MNVVVDMVVVVVLDGIEKSIKPQNDRQPTADC
jgi:hypothetical protein